MRLSHYKPNSTIFNLSLASRYSRKLHLKSHNCISTPHCKPLQISSSPISTVPLYLSKKIIDLSRVAIWNIKNSIAFSTSTKSSQQHCHNSNIIIMEKDVETLSTYVKLFRSSAESRCGKTISQRTALKFLAARKFDLKRSLDLFHVHEDTRQREGLSDIDINDDNFVDELDSGKFTILERKDPNQSTIAIFRAKFHVPNQNVRDPNVNKKQQQRTTLQAIVYQLDAILEDLSTQRHGIVFIYDMTDSGYSNFDMELCEKILLLLRGVFPARLKKILIVSSPIWFQAVYKFLGFLYPTKFRERTSLVNVKQLPQHIPIDSLPIDLGGTYEHNHNTWLQSCIRMNDNRVKNDHDGDSNFSKTIRDFIKIGPNDLASIVKQNILTDNTNLEQALLNPDLTPHLDNSKNMKTNNNIEGYHIQEFHKIFKEIGKNGFASEYDNILENEESGTFNVSNAPYNMYKNRYVNVGCYDHTRVILEPHDVPDELKNSNDNFDYINANYVDGFDKPMAYISTQGPTEHTIRDFWRMIWQTGSRVIVMVTLNVENMILKCDEYWPSSGEKLNAGVYTVKCLKRETTQDYVTCHLNLTDTKSNTSRDVWHLQFTSWPDFGTPSTAAAILKYRDSVLARQQSAVNKMKNLPHPPIVVHCSAGVGRSGTFITIDIGINKLEATGMVDVKGIVKKLREQRYSSIQTKEQYLFCYQSVLEYAVNKGLLESKIDF